MTTLTWIGGNNNEITNPKDWSPPGLPTMAENFEDNLIMTSGTMNINDYRLPPDTYLGIQNPGSVTLNLSHGAAFDVEVYDDASAGPTPPAMINIHGSDTLEVGVNYNSSTIVDLANNSKWIGNFAVAYGGASLIVNGPSSATFINTAEPNTTNVGASFGDGVMTINVSVSGIGTFTDDPYGVLTFSRAVGAGQTVDMAASDGASYPPPILNLNDPRDFSGTINLANGEINLNGLAKADSYSFKNDMLAIYSGKKVIDTLSLQGTAGLFAVEKTATGVSVYTTNDTSHIAGIMLLTHT